MCIPLERKRERDTATREIQSVQQDLTSLMIFHNAEVEELSHALQLSSCFSLCPTMDLVSFQLNDNVVWVYRRGNEKVWDIEHAETTPDEANGNGDGGNTKKIKDLAWKPDGRCFAVVSTDGLIELFDTMRGVLIRSIQLEMEISCVKWFKRNPEVNNGLNRSRVGGILDDVAITNSLPSLKFKMNNGTSGTSKEEDNDSVLDFLIAGSTGGSLSCVFSGIFVVENLTLCDIFENSEIMDIISNKSLSNHYVLLNTPASRDISVLKVDTDFIHRDKKFTKILLICSKLLNLIDHIKSSIHQIDSHYKPYFDYTIRIVELLRREIKEDEIENDNKSGNKNTDSAGRDDNDENDENDPNPPTKEDINNNNDPIYDLYDLLLTGSLSNATKKWLTDYLSDRGVKRWTKLGRTYFDNARSSIYNDLVSCLHHMIVFLTDLKGLSQWASNDTSLYTLDIEECIKISQSYLKYSYKFMMELNDSQRYFEQTIIWLSSILSELTADEKLNVSFRTNDITKFLMFVSSKINAVDSDSDHGSIHDASKVNEFTKYLDTVLNSLFGKIKNDIKSKFKLDTHSLLFSNENSSVSHVSMKIFSDDNKGHALMLLDSSQIVVKEFDLTTLDVQTYEMTREGTETITDMKIVSSDRLLVLFDDCVIMYKLLLDTKEAVADFKYVLQEHSNETDSDFQAGYLAVNEDKKLFCVLDKTKKKYVWISY